MKRLFFDETGKPSLGRVMVLVWVTFMMFVVVGDMVKFETAEGAYDLVSSVFWGLMAWVGVPRTVANLGQARPNP